MSHPSTEIRAAAFEVLEAIEGLPGILLKERALHQYKGDLPALNLSLGDTDVEVLNEAPREERRTLELRIAIKDTAATGEEVAEQLEAYADLVEPELLAVEAFGLAYVQRVDYLGDTWGHDVTGDAVIGVKLLRFALVYVWDYPERDGEAFETIVGGIDHNQDDEIETPLQTTLGA